MLTQAPQNPSCLILQVCLLFQQLKLVMDSIVWAFRHTERNVAETGLNLLLEMLGNFQVCSSNLVFKCCRRMRTNIQTRPCVGKRVAYMFSN